MTSKAGPKKIHNRYDYYQILSVFSDSTQQYLSKRHSTCWTIFIFKCILGPLLAINAYLSHWGPWKWPANQKFLIFSIVFYYAASYIYERLSAVKKVEGSLVGEFNVNGQKKKYVMRFEDNRLDYVLEEAESDTHKVVRRKAFQYVDYFTEDGEFVEEAYHRNLAGFLKSPELKQD